ncbi:iron-hydroxamate ABC transporter substrate-binding protein [Paenibacillus sp. VTT E-133280]|uniref:ABC transporter substrate-binding protein n=1 Tax=Paenibacillus sp. VTT E-133280 TaxID=1986222 RepID=UPI000BA18F00|nr:ABC transporter substrate-binding protein [Paenibacillus sp. VTT E-133280]OZQ60502.1 iron-hydroxamate ABC transporter substrate-binding protein [Paenibacillus sp. VTT E-133280]
MAKQWHAPLLLLTLCAFLLTACGSVGDTEVADADAALPALTLTDFAERQVSFPSVPQHIVALGNGEADIIIALGGTLVGKPTTSTPLKGTEEVMQIGTAHEVDLEKIAYLKADAVLGNTQMNAKDIPAIEGIGAKMVLTQANSVADITKQIRLFGQMLKKESEAQQLSADIEAEVKAATTNRTGEKPRVLLVYGAPGTYMVALPNSLGGNILELAGGDNIAADYPALQSYPQYATLNTERVMEANPQIILIMTHGNGEEVQKGFEQEMRQNAAWSSIDAVVHNRVRVLPADLFGTNPGTRVTEALQLLVSLFADLEAQ